jgi:branched-chain amino acid transport system ATP-binding protein
VSKVSLEVPEGKIVGLIGPNGAGKTTLVDAITGLVACEGRVEIAGEDVTRLKPHARARRGLGRTWQAVELFDDLTVAENVAVAIGTPSRWATIKDLFVKPTMEKARVGEALDAVGIGHLVDAMPTELSEGQRKLVGIARAFAWTNRQPASTRLRRTSWECSCAGSRLAEPPCCSSTTTSASCSARAITSS